MVNLQHPGRGSGTNETTNRMVTAAERIDPQPPQRAQVGGTHYKNMAIQPFEYIHKNGIGFAEGNVIKYVSRWRAKGGIEDLKKARHFIDLLIEAEKGEGAA